MKKKLLLMAVSTLVLLFAFTGCVSEPWQEVQQKSAPGPLRICVDLDYTGLSQRDTVLAMNEFLELVKEKGGPTDIEVEYLPRNGSEREVVVERIRSEIMSGGGPDVFIISGYNGRYMTGNQNGEYTDSVEALFQIPEKTMEMGLFLPLDAYIENAQFMEWDKLTPQIMEVGRTEEGQQLIPMTYTMPITFYRKSEVSHTPSADITWQDMLADESGIMTNAAYWIAQYRLDETWFEYSDDYLENILGDLADYKKEKLLFTEEELLQRMKEIYALHDRMLNGDFDALPANYKREMCLEYNVGIKYSDYNAGLLRDEETTMIPLYSDDGGVTATVNTYTCINRNTERAEDAFFLVDLLLSMEMQQDSDLYQLWVFQADHGIPVHMDLMQEAYPIDLFDSPNDWHMTDENYAEFCRVREQITRVHIRGGLDLELEKLHWVWIEEVERGTRDVDLEAYTAELYRTMKQKLSE